MAAIACAIVDSEGPLTGRRGEVTVVAPTFTQARIVFEDVVAYLGERHDLDDRAVWRRQASHNSEDVCLFRQARGGAGGPGAESAAAPRDE